MTTTGTSGRLATTRSQSARPSMPRMLRSVRTTSTSAVSSAASAATAEVCHWTSKPRGPSPAAIASHISRSSSTTRTRPLIAPPPAPGGSPLLRLPHLEARHYSASHTWRLAITPPPTPGGSRRRLRRLGRPRQEDRESAALPHLALDLDPAAVLCDDRVRDGEPEARPLPDRLGGEERLEDVPQVVARDAGALVRDRDAEVIRLGGAGSRRTDAAYAGVHAEPAAVRHRLDAVHEDVRQHLLDLVLVEAREQGTARRALQAHVRPLRHRGDQVERAPHQLLEVREAHRRAASPREVEELLDDPRHAVGLLEDRAAVRDGVGRRDSVGDEQLGACRHHVQRRAELVRDAGGELADGREPLAVAELFEGREARRGLVGGAAVRLGDPIAHRVDLGGDVAHLVVPAKEERLREVAGAGAPRLVAQVLERAADQPDVEEAHEQRTDDHDRDRRADDREVAHADERPLLRERLEVLDRRRLRGRPDRYPCVLPLLAFGVRQDAAQDVAGLEGTDVLGGERRAIRRVRREREDAEDTFRPRPVPRELDELPGARFPFSRPHRLDGAEPGETVSPRTMRVGLGEHDLVRDLHGRVDRHDCDHAEDERAGQLDGELHLALPAAIAMPDPAPERPQLSLRRL